MDNAYNRLLIENQSYGVCIVNDTVKIVITEEHATIMIYNVSLSFLGDYCFKITNVMSKFNHLNAIINPFQWFKLKILKIFQVLDSS
jgi:hypothetical protein